MWPDWKGQDVAIVASGPSAKKAGVSDLKGRVRVIAIKRSYELVPFADVVYGCDAPWWQSVQGLKEFKGLKLSWDDRVVGQFGIQKVKIPNVKSNSLLFEEVGSVGAGGNSGFQALNLAVQFGARRVLLIGFDMHGRSGEHWYGRNGWSMGNNPTEENYRRWRISFDGSAEDLLMRGIEVVNASPFSELKNFKRMSVQETLQTWGLQVAA